MPGEQIRTVEPVPRRETTEPVAHGLIPKNHRRGERFLRLTTAIIPGGGQCVAIGPDSRARGGDSISVRVFALTAERLPPPWHCVYGESPRGGGADGEGAERPFPCLGVSPGTVFQGGSRPPPPPGRSAASSRPLPRGRAVHGDSPDTVPGDRNRILRGVHQEPGEGVLFPEHCIDGKSPPPWGRG